MTKLRDTFGSRWFWLGVLQGAAMAAISAGLGFALGYILWGPR